MINHHIYPLSFPLVPYPLSKFNFFKSRSHNEINEKVVGAISLLKTKDTNELGFNSNGNESRFFSVLTVLEHYRHNVVTDVPLTLKLWKELSE